MKIPVTVSVDTDTKKWEIEQNSFNKYSERNIN